MTTSIADLLNAPPLSDAEEEEVSQLYEERADHLELAAFQNSTALTTDSADWVGALTGTGAKLLVGPRGCGKTHLMRFAFSECLAQPEHPFAVYTNLNRYYRLEPLLRRKPEAVAMFYVWVLANITAATHDAVAQFSESSGTAVDAEAVVGFDLEKVSAIVGSYEQGRPLTDELDAEASRLTIDAVKAMLLRVTEALGRRRMVLLLDDAALTLTPEYLSHFFDIYRALKAARIAPKASVYPGTTEYGANFHAAHEADSVFVWKAVTDANYLAYMEDIGAKRFPDMNEIAPELRAVLAYAAFGVPRAFMTLVRAFNKSQKVSAGHLQSAFNRVIEDFFQERVREYLTLRDKKPQLASIVSVGRELFDSMAGAVSDANQGLVDGTSRQLMIGIEATGVSGKPYVERMLRLLEEAGMIYKLTTVSHGDRDYLRFVPHVAALQSRRAFSRRGSFSPKFTIEMLQRPDEKHPVRRSMTTLLDAAKLEGLGLDLPNCVVCQTKRVEGAKYCYVCGAKLTDESTYDKLMLTQLSEVPGLTPWQRDRLRASPSVPKTVGEFIALQDRGTALRTIRHIGPVRAKTVIDAVEEFLNDYLS